MATTLGKQLKLGGQANDLTSQALQKSLLGYLGGAAVPPGQGTAGAFPGGLSLADMGFTGQVVPGVDPMQQQAWSQAQALQGSPENMQRQQALGSLLSGTPSFQADPAMRERYFQQAISDPAMQQYQQEILPMIAARFGRGGNLGAASWAGAQQGAQLSGQLAGQRAGLLRGDEALAAQSQDNAWNRAAQAVPLSYQNQAMGIGMLGAAGDQSRMIQGQQNQQRLMEAYMQQPFGDPRLSLFSMLPSSSVSTPGRVGAPSAGGSSLGATAGLLGAAIDPVGALLKGIF